MALETLVEQACRLCRHAGALHELTVEIRATFEVLRERMAAIRHEGRDCRQVVKCDRYLRSLQRRPEHH